MKQKICPRIFNILLVTTVFSTFVLGFLVPIIWWLFDIVLLVGIYHCFTTYSRKRDTNVTDTKPAKRATDSRPRPVKQKKQRPEVRTTMQLYFGEKDKGASQKRHFSPHPPAPADQEQKPKKGLFGRPKKSS